MLSQDDLIRARNIVSNMIEKYPDNIVYCGDFNQWVTNVDGIYDLDEKSGWAINCASRVSHSVRHYAPDLSPIESAKCCMPNTICKSCRASSMAMASAIDRLEDFSRDKQGFIQWLNIMEMWSKIYLIN